MPSGTLSAKHLQKNADTSDKGDLPCMHAPPTKPGRHFTVGNLDNNLMLEVSGAWHYPDVFMNLYMAYGSEMVYSQLRSLADSLTLNLKDSLYLSLHFQTEVYSLSTCINFPPFQPRKR